LREDGDESWWISFEEVAVAYCRSAGRRDGGLEEHEGIGMDRSVCCGLSDMTGVSDPGEFVVYFGQQVRSQAKTPQGGIAFGGSALRVTPCGLD